MLEYKSNIVIGSRSLSAEQISEILKINYDEKKDIGDPRYIELYPTCKENIWIIKSSADLYLPLSHHIENLLERIGTKIENFSKLGKDCHLCCQCYIDGAANDRPNIVLSANQIKSLSLICADLDIDAYLL
jgi:Domain of unknown function (DUF4279)